MKKSLFLLSLVAVAVTGCTNTSNTSAEVSDASTAWQTDVQTTEMPSTMTQPVYQPTYSPQPTAASYGYNTEVVGNCQVVRDGANKPIYTQITKGCYTGSTYTVGQFDTLYLIGYLTGTNADHIAALNGISSTSKLKVGSVLRVR